MQHPRTITETWLDKGRNRKIPVKIYLPDNEKKAPVLIFSHGIGGDCNSYQYIGEFLARHGFVSVHPTHVGIDASLMGGDRPFQKLKEAANDASFLHTLPEDIQFILDYMEFKAMPYDLSRVAMAGHSFGSYVTMALAGQSVSRDGTEIDFQDERIKCGVVISPLATRENPEEAYDMVEIPLLHITGQKDDSPFGLLDPSERRVPYDNMNETDQYLIIFEKADHLIFAAQRRQNKFSEDDVKIMELTASAIREFLKKYLLKDKSAIDGPEFSDRLKPYASFEKKLQK